jgi:hypothetical protein
LSLLERNELSDFGPSIAWDHALPRNRMISRRSPFDGLPVWLSFRIHLFPLRLKEMAKGLPAESASFCTKAPCLHHFHREVIEHSPEIALHVPSPTPLPSVYGGKAAAAHVFLPRLK